ncbi:MAG TPA: hypothetical protein VFU59_11260 [Candidatus Eisenbacteria bacterium]|nr:hypothetical protein [Candidatus Eisenbacteria bacterium]
MKTQSAVRRLAATALALAMGVSFALAPARSLAADEKPAAPAKALRVAVFPVENASPDLGAAKIMGDILREQLKRVPPEKATFLLPQDTERILSSRNELNRAYLLTERWSKHGTLDSTAVQGLDSLLMVDAILLVKVSEWENHRVPVVGAGESHAIVGLSFACYDVRTKARIWAKAPREQRFGQEIDPSSGSVSYDATGFIQNKRANDPPRYEDVASDLVRDAFKKFPAK